jgi:preprotein translocase subunit YajC
MAGAQAPAAQPPVPSVGERLLQMGPMLLMVYFIFYVLVIRPKQVEERAQKALLDGLKKGDAVVTSSGIFGRVVKVEDQSVSLEVAPQVSIRVERRVVVRKES